MALPKAKKDREVCSEQGTALVKQILKRGEMRQISLRILKQKTRREKKVDVTDRLPLAGISFCIERNIFIKFLQLFSRIHKIQFY